MKNKFFAVFTVTGFFLAAGVSTPSLVSAQLTKSEVRQSARTATHKGKVRWQSLSPETQQEVVERGRTRWQSLSPARQQELRQRARTRSGDLKRWYQSLPE
jgi:hypothetical protein